jgi:hypothetical protein
MNLDDLRRIAEQQLGKDTVARIERQLEKKAGGPREIMSASNIDFDPSRSEENADQEPKTSAAEGRRSADEARQDAPASPPSEVQSRNPTNLPLHAVAAPDPEPQAISPQKTPRRTAAKSASERLLAQAIAGEYRYAMLGLILGMTCIIGGVILCLNGVAGSTSWTAKLFGLFQSKINDAAPGVVLFVVGIFFVVATKPKVKLDKLRG